MTSLQTVYVVTRHEWANETGNARAVFATREHAERKVAYWDSHSSDGRDWHTITPFTVRTEEYERLP